MAPPQGDSQAASIQLIFSPPDHTTFIPLSSLFFVLNKMPTMIRNGFLSIHLKKKENAFNGCFFCLNPCTLSFLDRSFRSLLETRYILQRLYDISYSSRYVVGSLLFV